MAQNIYFDESGFTGNNLLSKDQPFFSYASVATDDVEAKEFVEHIISKYKITASELKGSTLVNSRRLRPAVEEILYKFRGRMRVIINEKKYALSGKFFEYVFEPVLAEKSSLFYNCSFHRFIANYLYFSLLINNEDAEKLHNSFENAMREKTPITDFLSPSTFSRSDEILKSIVTFTNVHIDIIKREVESLEGTGIDKWILDLTTAGLYNLLADWGKIFPLMNAICDSSKPLSANLDTFNHMVGSTRDQAFMEVRGESIPITFSLESEITLTDSKSSHGIQIADVIAAASVFILQKKNKEDPFTKKWINHFEDEIFYWQCCVVPSPENLDRSRYETDFNYYLLDAITKKSLMGGNCLDGIEAEFSYINRILKLYT